MMLVPIGTVISSGKRVMTSIRMARYGMLEANLALGNWINLEQLLEFPRISGVKFGIYWAIIVFGVLVIDAMPVGAADGTVAPALRVLRDECIGCHKPGKAKGGLLLTTREKMLLGGDEGAVVEPGKPDQSPLVTLLAAGCVIRTCRRRSSCEADKDRGVETLGRRGELRGTLRFLTSCRR
jgi:hypothetical protein